MSPRLRLRGSKESRPPRCLCLVTAWPSPRRVRRKPRLRPEIAVPFLGPVRPLRCSVRRASVGLCRAFYHSPRERSSRGRGRPRKRKEVRAGSLPPDPRRLRWLPTGAAAARPRWSGLCACLALFPPGLVAALARPLSSASKSLAASSQPLSFAVGPVASGGERGNGRPRAAPPAAAEGATPCSIMAAERPDGQGTSSVFDGSGKIVGKAADLDRPVFVDPTRVRSDKKRGIQRQTAVAIVPFLCYDRLRKTNVCSEKWRDFCEPQF